MMIFQTLQAHTGPTGTQPMKTCTGATCAPKTHPAPPFMSPWGPSRSPFTVHRTNGESTRRPLTPVTMRFWNCIPWPHATRRAPVHPPRGTPGCGRHQGVRSKHIREADEIGIGEAQPGLSWPSEKRPSVLSIRLCC